MLFENKCFKFLYEFFYGVCKGGLNTQQNSSAAHCFAIFHNSIIKFHDKIELKFCRNCTKQTFLCLSRVLAGIEIFIFHPAPNSGTSTLYDNPMKNMFLRAHVCPFTNGQYESAT